MLISVHRNMSPFRFNLFVFNMFVSTVDWKRTCIADHILFLGNFIMTFLKILIYNIFNAKIRVITFVWISQHLERINLKKKLYYLYRYVNCIEIHLYNTVVFLLLSYSVWILQPISAHILHQFQCIRAIRHS